MKFLRMIWHGTRALVGFASEVAVELLPLACLCVVFYLHDRWFYGGVWNYVAGVLVVSCLSWWCLSFLLPIIRSAEAGSRNRAVTNGAPATR